MNETVNTFVEVLSVWVVTAVPRLLTAIIILAVGIWFANWCSRTLRSFATRHAFLELTLTGVLAAVLRYAVLAIVFIAVFNQLGIATTSILAVLGAAGLAIGLALQGTLQNIAAGIMLLWLRPFRVGDYIDSGSITGTVKDVGLFSTEIHTYDALYVFAPNSELWNRKLVNYSRLPTRMVEVKFGIGYDDDIQIARSVMLRLAANDERLLSDPEPMVFVSSLGDSAVELSLRVWTARTEYSNVQRVLLEAGKNGLEAAGLSIPFPQQDVHLIPADKPATAESN
jgi:small conductance mechanosensitive channel